MKSKMMGIIAASVLVVSTQASAVVFDFVDLEANGSMNATGVYSDGTTAYTGMAGENAFQSFTWMVGGVSLTVSGTESDGTTAAYAYLDGPTLLDAGLGVCRKANTGFQCNPNSDDNLDASEILHLNFDSKQDVSFAQSVFRDARHFVFNPTAALVSTDGGMVWNQLDPTGVLLGVDHVDIGMADHGGEEMYISSLSTTSSKTVVITQVPEPTALALMGLGLIGMGLVKRRKL